jgi:rod shape-determining protein MreD
MRPEYLLLPANRAFIAFSLILAFLLNLLPWTRMSFAPDFVALVLVFWNVHQPRKVGMGLAFLFGLLMDVHDASLFGEHALSYTLFSAISYRLTCHTDHSPFCGWRSAWLVLFWPRTYSSIAVARC